MLRPFYLFMLLFIFCLKQVATTSRCGKRPYLCSGTRFKQEVSSNGSSLSVKVEPLESMPFIQHTATYRLSSTYDSVLYGTIATLSVHEFPATKNRQDTEATVVVWNVQQGRNDSINAIHAGWGIAPYFYRDNKTHFYVKWTADGYKSTGCTDLKCDGFVPVNYAPITPGDSLEGKSKITIKIFKQGRFSRHDVNTAVPALFFAPEARSMRCWVSLGLVVGRLRDYQSEGSFEPLDALRGGFAIGSAALVSLALFGAFVSRAEISTVDVLTPKVFIGLIVGAMLPYWFSAMTMKSVGSAALKMVEEVRRQFNTIPGLMEGTTKPDYATCVKISTDASIKEMIPPGALVMLTPLIVGILFGVETLSGILAGALVSGVQIAISASNTGGAWDNAKKYIEAGSSEHARTLGPKGSDPHKAAVIGDTIGDPLKDTSGPSLNILIKLMAVESLVFAPFFATHGGILFKWL
ncbi:hypothetical protein EJB05_41676 [Eragrostis curvula]|uniref:H(+)-exporting diphosphatase n=1 Tax=Eragrostis curvula TaxID=38414 RepID=A0A5J9TBB9_9POAL|nr:hypothetical protein EJB05_41676 [Eragrostis curvula]